ncbi:MAG: pyridoxal-phosphate-dependent aminotransferase family protein [Fimbriimonas sp.]
MILLTPGPCMTSESVRQAGALPDLNHREPEYLDLIQETKERLLGVHPGFSDWHPFVIGGSGTAAVEAMITSCVDRGPVLILANGYYSDRIAAIFRVYGIPHQTLHFPWLSAWDMEAVENALATGEFEAVFAVHHETTTGRLNPISDLAGLCKRHGVRCLIDVMSSFGADELTAKPGLSAICASANKNLHGLPGVAFVLTSPELAEEMASFPRRSYYLSLPMYAGDSPPLTPPVPTLFALRQALREFDHDERRATYLARNRRLREAIAGWGLEMPVPVDEASCTLVMASIPARFKAEEWFARNREAGFMLYGCKAELAERYFQVANMGELPPSAIEDWIAAVDSWLR